MIKKPTRATFRLGWLDFGLSAFASCLSVYSVGMGLRVPEISWFFIGWIIFGTFCSFIVSRLLPDRLTWLSGMFYSLMAVFAVGYVQPLNSILPGEGFPLQLIIAGSLAWMFLFGSFLMWRDSTIVFQAVPSIALFGLVGAWDTFGGAPFAFFGFLLCFAMLFARAHGRVMVLQAEESGFQSQDRSADQRIGSSFQDALHHGPWRWMAGPEWALGSAAVIILLSVLGAPVLQSSVQGVAGFVKINVPQSTPSTGTSTPAFPTSGGALNVGQGPRKLQHKPVYAINLSEPRYMRMHTYDEYTGRGWRMVADFLSLAQSADALRDQNSFMNRSRNAIVPSANLTFETEFFDGYPDATLPVPGDVVYLDNVNRFARRADGTIRLIDSNARGLTAGGTVTVRASDEPPTTAIRNGMRSYMIGSNQNPLPNRVRMLVKQVTADSKNDYERAVAIKRTIEKRVKYDLEAPGVPAGRDPVDYFLFENRRGYCDLFATSMTMMAREAGLPARYVTGYYPALNERDDQGRLVIHESEAHAWCEIFFEGAGWVVFDATEGAEDVGSATQNAPFWDRSWVRASAFVIVGLAIIGGPILFSTLVRRRKAKADPVRSELGKLYGRFVRTLEKRSGKPKRPSQTPFEYLETLRDLLPMGYDQAEMLNQRFAEALYAPPATAEKALGDLRSAVAAFSRSFRR